MHPPRCAASRCQPQRLCRTVFTISRRLPFGSLRYLPISAVVSADSPAARLTAVLIVVQLELPSPRTGGTLALPPSTASCGGIFNPKGPLGNAGMAFATLMKSSQCHKCNQRAAVPSRSALCSWIEAGNVLKEPRNQSSRIQLSTLELFGANGFHLSASPQTLVSEFSSRGFELTLNSC